MDLVRSDEDVSSASEASTLEESVSRKRALSINEDPSDNALVISPKISTANRGRRGRNPVSGTHTGLAHAKKELSKPSAETYRLNRDCEAESPAVKTKTGRKVYSHLSEETLDAEDLWKRALDEVEVIQEQSRKSKNLKGTIKGTINQSLITMRDIIDCLKTRTVNDETKRLQADNDRLSRELASLKAEMGAFRRDYEERNMRANAAASTLLPPAPSQGVDVEEVVRRVTISVGEMVNARIAGIEDRLLPAKTLRPPLAADKRRGLPTTISASPALTEAPARPTRLRNQARHEAQPSSAQTSSSQPTAPSSANINGEGWATVAKRGNRKGKLNAPNANISSAPQSKPRNPVVTTPNATRPKLRRKKPKLGLPRSAAVVITLQPEAIQRGMTYTDVLTKAKASINLAELGIDGVRSRLTATGARALELPGATSGPKADLLAEKLRSALGDDARVVRPVKCVDLRISGLDDSICKDDVAAAIATRADCLRDSIKVGEIRVGPGGSGVAIVQCPVQAAKVVLEKGRLLVGWSSARVFSLDPRPLRCFRCMGVGHTRQLCPSDIDRGELCFRCGREGHKSATCTVEPKCALCADARRPSGHVMGSRKCKPPAVKGKSVPMRQSIPQLTTEMTRSNAGEEVLMSD